MELLKLLWEKSRHVSDGMQTGHGVDDDHYDGVCEDVDSDFIDEQGEGTVEAAQGEVW